MPSFDSFGPFLALCLGFGFIIFVHELGHFLVAKWVGIKVLQFAVGFGKSLFAYRKGIGWRIGTTEPEYEKRIAAGVDPDSMGETEYRLNWMPLGGYVKMLGQDDMDPSAQETDDSRSYSNKPIWARAAVISAGVVMNLIFGLIFFIIAFTAGVKFPPAQVGVVYPGLPAAETYAVGHNTDDAYKGLKPGDVITHVNGEPTIDFMDIAVNTALVRRGSSVRLTVDREGMPSPIDFDIKPKLNPMSNLLSIGIEPPNTLTLPDYALITDELKNAGVKPGMRVVKVDGKDVTHHYQYKQAVEQAQGRPVTVTFEAPDGSTQIDAAVYAMPGLRYAPLDDSGMPTAEARAQILGMVPATGIMQVVPDSPAAEMGLQAGDVLAEFGGKRWPQMVDVHTIVGQSKKRPITVQVWRDGQLITLPPTAPRKGKIGIAAVDGYRNAVVAMVQENSPAAALNLTPGSEILALNGQKVGSFSDIQRVLCQLATTSPQESEVTFEFRLNITGDPVQTGQVEIDQEQLAQFAEAIWGQPLAFEQLRISVAGDNPVEATKIGLIKTKQFILQTYVTLARLFQRSVKMEHLRGPLGIMQEGTRVAKQGWTYLLFFLGLISINLVVINFLPIPIVDGGHIVLLVIEKIKGSPVSVRIQNIATIVGLALIGMVFLTTLWYDVIRIYKDAVG